jgi:carnitine 3-dehydrogenase / betainyl-CoA thioesterase
MGSPSALIDGDGRMLQLPPRWQPGDVVPAPLDFYRGEVLSAWVDYNHHMTEAAYLTAFGWASDALFAYIGDDDAYRAAGHSFYTVETHIAYLREAMEHAPLRITTRVLGIDRKRLLIYHEMFRGGDDSLLATTEQMLVHVDMAAGRSVATLPEVQAALVAVAAAHSTLPPAARAGHFSVDTE